MSAVGAPPPPSRRRGRRAPLAAAAVLLLALATPGARGGAQSSPSAHAPLGGQPTLPAVTRSVAGRVVSPVDTAVRGVPGVWVTLHRISRAASGPIDSSRSAADGGYAFRWRAAADEDASYVVSAMHAGIAHFSEPLQTPDVRDGDAEIVVFDTTSAPIPIHVRGRHLVISARTEDRARQVIEVYELSNDTTLTRVSAPGRPVWSAVVPAEARRARVSDDSDLAEGAVEFRDGRVQVVAPISPGLRQVSFRYELPERAFPLSVPVLQGAEVLEVLVEEPQAQVRGARLAEVDSTGLEGRTFRRFLARGVDSTAVVRVEVPSALAGRRTTVIATVAAAIALVMVGALVVVLARRRAAQ